MSVIPSWFEADLPSLDNIFGIRLWPIFNAVFERVSGTPADDFRFIPGVTPASTFVESAKIIGSYYIIIFGGAWLMKTLRIPPIKLNFLFQIHNILLTSVSLVLYLLLAEQIVPIVVRHGLLFAICSGQAYTQKLVAIYYINYLVKYVELLDTVFLVLRKKPLTFLHTFHHGATALLCYTQLTGATAVQWVPIGLNLWVHVVMYFYYFLAACGIRVWWKKFVTTFQIIQFVIDLCFVYFASYTHFSYMYWPSLPDVGDCYGSEGAAIFGVSLLTSYLVLFIGFYIKVYKKPAEKGRKLGSTKTGGSSASAKASVKSSGLSTPGKARSRRV